ncbi:MAG TPA: hypothetical protein PK849_03500, partial [Synergistales bacterium]|nr:hypothetical protein [Synergistales bacterium]
MTKCSISFSGERAPASETVLSDAREGWSLFSIHDRVFCIDISGSRLWELFPAPRGESLAMLSLFSPSI